MEHNKKSQEFYKLLFVLKNYINKYIEDTTLKYLMLNELLKLNETNIVELNEITKNYMKENSLESLELYYYERGSEKVQKWLIKIIKQKNNLQMEKENRLSGKRLGINYKLKSIDFIKLIEIQSNENFSEDKKALYKQLILNFSSNLYVQNLEEIIDILIAIKNRNTEKITKMLNVKSLKQAFTSSTSKKEDRLTKVAKMLILVYWPVGCFSPKMFNELLYYKYAYVREEVLTLKFDEILSHLKDMQNINFHELFYKGSNKNINFNYFLSEFTKYKPKDFQPALKLHVALLKKLATKEYLIWFFTEKVPNKWKSFVFAIEYIEQNGLFAVHDKIEMVFNAKLEREDFIESFEKLNFNPYKNTNILKILKQNNIFLENIIKHIGSNKENIDSYGWLSFYVYADKKYKRKFSKDIVEFFKNKSFEIQNQILLYYFSFYPTFEKIHFEFLFYLIYFIDKNNFSVPDKVKKIQEESLLGLDYKRSYIFSKSLKKRESILKFLYKKLEVDFIYNFENIEKILPSVYYVIYSNNDNIIEEQIKHKETDNIFKFISLIN